MRPDPSRPSPGTFPFASPVSGCVAPLPSSRPSSFQHIRGPPSHGPIPLSHAARVPVPGPQTRAGTAVQRRRRGDAPGGVGFLCACARARVRESPARVEAPVPPPRHSWLCLPWQAPPLRSVACLQLVSGTGLSPAGPAPAAPPPRPRGQGQFGAPWSPRTAPGGVGGVVAFAGVRGRRKLCEAAVVAEGSSELDVLAVPP